MKEYDYEPSLAELIQQLEDEFAFLPSFIPSDNITEPVKKEKINLMVKNYISRF